MTPTKLIGLLKDDAPYAEVSSFARWARDRRRRHAGWNPVDEQLEKGQLDEKPVRWPMMLLSAVVACRVNAPLDEAVDL